jgi:hypothetical protein
LDTLSLLEGYNGKSKLLIKARILHFFMMNKRGLTVNSVRLHLKEVYNIDYKRVVSKYIKELEDATVIRNISKTKPYKYKIVPQVSDFEIKQNDNNIEMLKSWIEILRVYDFLPFFDDLEPTIEQLIQDYNGKTNNTFKIIQFETNSNIKNKDELGYFYEKIEMREEVSFKYTNYGSDKPIYIKKFQSYLIKEHKGRWYIIGRAKYAKEWMAYSVDRISDLEDSDNIFKRQEVDFDKLWKHSMGIYLNWTDDKGVTQTKPIKISFKLKNGDKYNNILYLKSTPLHKTQKVNITDDYGYAEVTLKMFPDTDLVRTIRSFGLHNIKDVKPEFFRTWLFEG